MARGRPPSSDDPTRSQPASAPPPSGAPGDPAPEEPATGDDQRDGRFAAGTLLAGRYRIVGLLGRGGMGEVYRADDLPLGVSVALKFLPPQRSDDERSRQRLHGEVRIAREVAHRHVCRVYDIVDHGDEAFIAMEYVDGENLAALLRRIGRFPEERGIEIARQICAGLAAAHERGIVHQDLKPANVMLDGRGQARITDFGIAALASERNASGAGTPAYMAPEQLDGKPFTARSDLYALGLVLHEIFTGRPAVDVTSVEQLRRQYESGSGASTTHLERIDPAIAGVILRCLEIDPARRPPSALAVAAALPGGDPLAAALEAGETPSPELVAAASAKGRLHPALAVLGALVIAGGITVLVTMGNAFTLHRHLSMEKHPEALLDRAAEVLHTAGWRDPPTDTAYGFRTVWEYITWINRLDDPPDPLRHLKPVRPEALAFWYRQSPEKIVPAGDWATRGLVGPTDPPWTVEGEAYVSLDMAGRLRRFYVIPRQKLEPAPEAGAAPIEAPAPAAIDWPKLFELAGLEIGRFQPAEPRYTWDYRCDHRLAWSGAYPEDPAVPLRVEAGDIDGKPQYFRFVCPWDEPKWESKLPPRRINAFRDWFQKALGGVIELSGPLVMSILVSLPLITAILSVRKAHRARADRRGAWRVALGLFWCMVLWGLLSGDEPWPRRQSDVWHIMSVAFFIGGTAGGLYFGLEPYIRRIWPHSLVRWTRLLSGRLLDPLVGRSILAGLIGGVIISILQQLSAAQGLFADASPPSVFWGQFDFAWRGHLALAALLICFTIPILMGFTYLLLLVFLRHITGRLWLAAAIFVAMYPFMELWDSHTGPARMMVAIPSAAVILLLCMRTGMLAVLTCLASNTILVSVPLVSELGTWYAKGTIITLGFVATLTAGAAWAAAAGRSSFPRGSSLAG